MRVETNIVMNKWNRSGNGEGTTPRPDECADEYDPNDHLGGSSEDRANFLGTSGPHILYLWQKSDDFGILKQVVQCQMIADGQEFDGTAPSVVYKKKNPKDKAAVDDIQIKREAFLSQMNDHIRDTNSNLALHNLENMQQTLGDLQKRLHDAEDKYDDLKGQEKPPKRTMKGQSNRIKEIWNDIMCKQADIQEFQKKLSVAAPRTEGTSAADSTERAADAGGSSPPAEQDPDYSTDDEDL